MVRPSSASLLTVTTVSWWGRSLLDGIRASVDQIWARVWNWADVWIVLRTERVLSYAVEDGRP
jgi:hypothetical protein